MYKKRKKRIEITGRWVDIGNRIIKYNNINNNVICSKCNGTDINCPICHGQSIEKKPRWYQLIKKLKKVLK